jgi:hypothetical protein
MTIAGALLFIVERDSSFICASKASLSGKCHERVMSIKFPATSTNLRCNFFKKNK